MDLMAAFGEGEVESGGVALEPAGVVLVGPFLDEEGYLEEAWGRLLGVEGEV